MKPIYKTIMRQYEITRDKHTKAQAKRKLEIFTKIPRIKAIDQELSTVGIELAKAVFENPEHAESAAQKIKSIATRLQKEKAILLTDHNFPLNYLDLDHTCHLCQDTGFNSSGKRCQCFKQALIDHAYAMSSISARLKIENFSTFNFALFKAPKVLENVQQLYDSALAFVKDFNMNNNENLLFYGNTGLGKTFLCSCIAKAIIDQGRSVIYQTSFKLMDTVQLYKFSDKQDPLLREAYDLLFQADLLIIDDMGTEMINSFTQTEFFNIINARMLAEKKTIISTNMDLIELGQAYGERIASRLYGSYHVLEFIGTDLRLK